MITEITIKRGDLALKYLYSWYFKISISAFRGFMSIDIRLIKKIILFFQRILNALFSITCIFSYSMLLLQ